MNPPAAATGPNGSTAPLPEVGRNGSTERGFSTARINSISSHAATLNTTTGALHFDGTEIIVRTGGEVILAGDLLASINEGLEARVKNSGRSLADIAPDELDAARVAEMKRQLPRAIESKLLFIEARRKIPKDNLPKVEEHANQIFEKEELKRMMDNYKIKTRGELDARLHQYGTSIDAQRRAFFERGVGMQFLHQQTSGGEEKEVSHDEMLEYYRTHIADYETAPRARWEQILIRMDKHEAKEDAYRKIAECGNEILRGVPFADVAKEHSHDSTSVEGGVHDWTTKGSLKYQPLDEAIFNLPVGKLSPIIEDDRGFSIIRVVEREGMTRTPFSEAQTEIKKEIKKHRNDGKMEAYVEAAQGQSHGVDNLRRAGHRRRGTSRGHGPPRKYQTLTHSLTISSG